MNIIVVDDERPALARIERAIAKNLPDAAIHAFLCARDALAYAEKNAVEIAFLDIEMSEMNGLALAKNLKDIRGQTNIIFVTGYPQYGVDAFAVRASGYVMKPITAEDVAWELNNLRTPLTPAVEHGVRIQCFGNFGVFVNGELLSFRWAKSKEIFAYLVDRKGASVSKKELAAILWEDEIYNRSKQMQLQKLLAQMKRALEEAGVGDIIIQSRGYYALDISKVSCDYYDYEKSYAAAVNSYRGEYMTNYEWGEFTAGHLSSPTK